MKFEYKVVFSTAITEWGCELDLNKCGEAGWELVSVLVINLVPNGERQTRYFFKRVKQ